MLIIASSAAVCSSGERAAHADTNFSVALTFQTSVQQANLRELNEALSASGHAPLSDRDILPGMGIAGSIDRFRLGWDIGVGVSRELRHEATGWTGDVYQFQTFVDGGYDVFRSDGWAIAGHGGVGFSKFSLDAMPSHPPFSPAAFDPLAGETSLEQSSGLVRAALGVTYYPQTLTPSHPHDRTEIGGPILVFDLRAGYQQAFASGGWNDMVGDAELSSSPTADLSGPFVMFTVGVGGGSEALRGVRSRVRLVSCAERLQAGQVRAESV